MGSRKAPTEQRGSSQDGEGWWNTWKTQDWSKFLGLTLMEGQESDLCGEALGGVDCYKTSKGKDLKNG